MIIVRDRVTQLEIDSIQHHPGWDDGREGWMWCRFDALLDENLGHRAEITWGDDSESDDYDPADPRPLTYFSPELRLETNTRVAEGRSYRLETLDERIVAVTHSEAVALLMSDPRELLVKYREFFAGRSES